MNGITSLVLFAGLTFENILLLVFFVMGGSRELGTIDLEPSWDLSAWRTRKALTHPLTVGIALSTILLGVASGTFAVLVVLTQLLAYSHSYRFSGYRGVDSRKSSTPKVSKALM